MSNVDLEKSTTLAVNRGPAESEKAKSLSQFGQLVSLLSDENPFLRILEVRAGAGALTSRVLPELSSSSGFHFEVYDYTDTRTEFFEKAKRKFARWNSWIRFRKLEITKSRALQGFDPFSYDLVIIISNDTSLASLDSIRGLLTPGGVLIMVQLDTPDPAGFHSLSEVDWNDHFRRSRFESIDTLKGRTYDHREFSILWSRACFEGHTVVPEVGIISKQIPPEGLVDQIARVCSSPSLPAQTIKHMLMSAASHQKGIFIYLDEVWSPFLGEMHATRMRELQNLLANAEGILWVTRTYLFQCFFFYSL